MLVHYNNIENDIYRNLDFEKSIMLELEEYNQKYNLNNLVFKLNFYNFIPRLKDNDINYLLGLSYKECCNFLKNKYGPIYYPYFVNENCKSKNEKIMRGKFGIYVHHIDEDIYANLCNPEIARNLPFSSQLGHKLVYCNLLEHFVLHIKIFEYPNPKCIDKNISVAGTYLFLIPELNDIYSGIKYNLDYKINTAMLIINQKDEYLKCIEHLIKIRDSDLYSYLTSYAQIYSNNDILDLSNIYNDITNIYNLYGRTICKNNKDNFIKKNFIKIIFKQIKNFLLF